MEPENPKKKRLDISLDMDKLESIMDSMMKNIIYGLLVANLL